MLSEEVHVYQHPVLVEALVRDRVAGLRHSARASARAQGEKRRQNLVAAARQGTGWLLIDLGLKLATPRGGRRHLMAGERR